MVESKPNARLARNYYVVAILAPPFDVLGLLIGGLAMMLIWLIGMGAESLAKDYRDDPAYKRNVQKLIERNRQFEKTE